MTVQRIVHKGQLYVLAADPPEEAVPTEDTGTEEDKGDQVVEDPSAAEDEPPDAAEMVQDIEDEPVEAWEEYLQPIIRSIKQQLGGVPISLVSPQVSTDFVSPQFGFYLEGYVSFPDGTPEDILEEFGDVPVQFKAYVDPDGKLMQPIETFTEVIAQK